MQIREKLHPDHLIIAKGIPELLQKIDNKELSCTISNLRKRRTITGDQLKSLNACLNKFAREANIKFHEPYSHTMAPECMITYHETQKSDKHPLVRICVYGVRMIEMEYANEKLVFTIEKKDWLQLMDLVLELCPSQEMTSFVEAMRQASE
jgi:hypothetical protein